MFELTAAAPESLGVPSAAVERFLDHLDSRGLPMHSVLMLRDQKLFVEAYWKPFDENRKHRMYSTSKSFTSAAIGILIGEGKLSLDDKICDFFPDKLPDEVHPYIAEATVRDLLMMSTTHVGTTYRFGMDEWASPFFRPSENMRRPGRTFSYDTSASTILCMLVKRLSGQELTEYLRERFFAPAGMNTDIACVRTPCGYDWGGSGVLCTPRDLMKFALTFLNGGRLGGVQIVPEDYARAATSLQIDNTMRAVNSEKCFGYGYQFWMHRHGWMCSGMGGQMVFAYPEYDFICITTGDTQSIPDGSLEFINAINDHILPFLQAGKTLPADDNAHARLCRRLDTLSLVCCQGEKTSPTAQAVSGRTYTMSENAMGLKWVRFTYAGEEGVWEYENATGVHSIPFGFGHHAECAFPETHYYGRQIGTPLGEGYPCCVSAGWVMPRVMNLRVFAIGEYFGTLRLQVSFDGDTVTLFGLKSAEQFFLEYVGFASGTAQ